MITFLPQFQDTISAKYQHAQQRISIFNQHFGATTYTMQPLTGTDAHVAQLTNKLDVTRHIDSYLLSRKDLVALTTKLDYQSRKLDMILVEYKSMSEESAKSLVGGIGYLQWFTNVFILMTLHSNPDVCFILGLGRYCPYYCAAV
jgi:uncharacterized membrane protein